MILVSMYAAHGPISNLRLEELMEEAYRKEGNLEKIKQNIVVLAGEG